MTASSSTVRDKSSIVLVHVPKQLDWTSLPSVLDSDKLRLMTSVQIERQKAIYELIETEKTFVSELRFIIDDIRSPVLEKKLLHDKDVEHFDSVFGDLWNVLLVNTELLQMLEQSQHADIKRVDMFSGSIYPILERMEIPYARFCNSYDKNLAAMKRLRLRNTTLNEYLQKAHAFGRKERHMPFEITFSLPLQRLAKYHLIFMKILEFTPIEHPDHDDLEKVVSKVLSIVRNVDRIRGIRDELKRLRLLDQELCFKHVLSLDGKKKKLDCSSFVVYRDDHSRRFLLQENFSTIQVLHSRSNTKYLLKDTITLILLNDMLIVGKPMTAAEMKKDTDKKYKAVHIVPLCDVSVLDMPDFSKEVKHVMQLKLGSGELYYLSSNTPTSRLTWIEKINKSKAEAVETEQQDFFDTQNVRPHSWRQLAKVWKPSKPVDVEEQKKDYSDTMYGSTMLDNEIAELEFKKTNVNLEEHSKIPQKVPSTPLKPAPNADLVHKLPARVYFWNPDLKPAKWVSVGHCRVDVYQLDEMGEGQIAIFAIPITGRPLFVCNITDRLSLKPEQEPNGNWKMTLSMQHMVYDSALNTRQTKLRIILIRLVDGEKLQSFVDQVEFLKKIKQGNLNKDLSCRTGEDLSHKRSGKDEPKRIGLLEKEVDVSMVSDHRGLLFFTTTPKFMVQDVDTNSEEGEDGYMRLNSDDDEATVPILANPTWVPQKSEDLSIKPSVNYFLDRLVDDVCETIEMLDHEKQNHMTDSEFSSFVQDKEYCCLEREVKRLNRLVDDLHFAYLRQSKFVTAWQQTLSQTFFMSKKSSPMRPPLAVVTKNPTEQEIYMSIDSSSSFEPKATVDLLSETFASPPRQRTLNSSHTPSVEKDRHNLSQHAAFVYTPAVATKPLFSNEYDEPESHENNVSPSKQNNLNIRRRQSLADAQYDSQNSQTDQSEVKLLKLWQYRVLISGLLAYTGYYFCRTDLIVCLNTILKSLPGVDKAEFGTIISFGYMLYAAGKIVSGVLIDQFGGAPIFVGGLIGSIISSIMFANIQIRYDGEHKVIEPKKLLTMYGIIWSLNRAAQSAGWGALVKTLHSWFPQRVHGSVLGVASLSYGIGDVLIRVFLGRVLVSAAAGVDVLLPEQAASAWQRVFQVAILCTSFLVLPSAYYFKSSPGHVQELKHLDVDEILAHQDSKLNYTTDESYSKLPRASKSRGFKISADKSQVPETLKFLIASPKFWVLLFMSPCLTLIRETFISWTAVFLSDTLKIKDGDAAMLSMLIPLFGTFSTLLGGWAVDRVRPARRGLIPVICLAVLMMTLLFSIQFIPTGLKKAVAPSPWEIFQVCFLLSIISLSLMAPFSFVDGLFVLSLAGKHGPGLAVGIINAVGYTGAILAGHEMGSIAQNLGWQHVFRVLASISAASFSLSLVYWWLDLKELRRYRSRSKVNWKRMNGDNATKLPE